MAVGNFHGLVITVLYRELYILIIAESLARSTSYHKEGKMQKAIIKAALLSNMR